MDCDFLHRRAVFAWLTGGVHREGHRELVVAVYIRARRLGRLSPTTADIPHREPSGHSGKVMVGNGIIETKE